VFLEDVRRFDVVSMLAALPLFQEMFPRRPFFPCFETVAWVAM
jgi:hypothetical protein